MNKTREVRITGGRDELREMLQQLVDQIDNSETDDVEAEVTIAANSGDDPTLLLNLNSTGCDEGDLPLVEYTELDDAAES